ncbi:hypothetical protein LBE40_00850 [Bartonella taylorii]|uniref:Uncharacterized protein n=2 Tax=Bartonella taylorii TaxID=33046 RepID=A0A9Q8YYV8_BARTA|nr:hypothetical protein [Bartonella taylorii]EJF92813.1 hypothetical protein ME9_01516 [Bartonella taylorii 8TBB]OPB34891.1 hypothetical protein Btaycd_010580 [Bartonella taylorii]USP01414.1 hypothetical protein LBE40_00850 [Bartonella taylorii]USP03526.1 hypothetical protein LAJ60_03660 [Bartonella taylorii]
MITSEVFTLDFVIIRKKLSVIGSGQKIRSGDLPHAVFWVKQGSSLFVEDNKVNVNHVHGLVGESAPAIFSHDGFPQNMSEIVVENSDILIKGRGARGLYFLGGSSEGRCMEGEQLVKLGEFQFKKTTFKVPDGMAIYIDDSRRYPYIVSGALTYFC